MPIWAVGAPGARPADTSTTRATVMNERILKDGLRLCLRLAELRRRPSSHPSSWVSPLAGQPRRRRTALWRFCPRPWNTTHCPSGETNGCRAPCVPGSSRIVASFMCRTNNLLDPPESEPSKTSRRRSGETTRLLNVGAYRGLERYVLTEVKIESHEGLGAGRFSRAPRRPERNRCHDAGLWYYFATRIDSRAGRTALLQGQTCRTLRERPT